MIKVAVWLNLQTIQYHAKIKRKMSFPFLLYLVKLQTTYGQASRKFEKALLRHLLSLNNEKKNVLRSLFVSLLKI